MKRIVYKKITNPMGETKLVSKNAFELMHGEIVVIEIDPEGKTGRIKTIDDYVVQEFTATSHHKLKIKIKNYLGKNGVEFLPEKRAPRKKNHLNEQEVDV